MNFLLYLRKEAHTEIGTTLPLSTNTSTASRRPELINVHAVLHMVTWREHACRLGKVHLAVRT